MSELIVSFAVIQRRAREAAAAAQCPHAVCPWPPESAAGQAFQLEFHAQQAHQGAALGRKEVSHVHTCND